MTGEILSNLGIDIEYLVIILVLIQVLVFIMLIHINMKYNRLKRSYSSFMKGKNGKTLEESLQEKIQELDDFKNQIGNLEDKIKELHKLQRKVIRKRLLSDTMLFRIWKII